MRTTIALAAAAAFWTLGSWGASAAPPQLAGVQATGQGATVQQVDWYCGPQCHYWHHRHWQERYGYYRPHWYHHHWHQYGYYHPYGYYGYRY